MREKTGTRTRERERERVGEKKPEKKEQERKSRIDSKTLVTPFLVICTPGFQWISLSNSPRSILSFETPKSLLACGKRFPLRTEADNGCKLRYRISEILMLYYYETCHNSKSPRWILEFQSSEGSTGLWLGVSIENRGRQWLEIEKWHF